MNVNLLVALFEHGGNLLSQFMHSRPVKVTRIVQAAPATEEKERKPYLDRTPTFDDSSLKHTVSTAKSFEGQTEAGYRAECCVKHFSTALGVFKEAIDRASDKMDDGVTQKVREGMVALNSAEPDIAVMIGLDDDVITINSGLRNLRKSVMKSRLETGGGTLQDLEGVYQWTAKLLDKAYKLAEKHPGTECEKVI